MNTYKRDSMFDEAICYCEEQDVLYNKKLVFLLLLLESLPYFEQPATNLEVCKNGTNP